MLCQLRRKLTISRRLVILVTFILTLSLNLYYLTGAMKKTQETDERQLDILAVEEQREVTLMAVKDGGDGSIFLHQEEEADKDINNNILTKARVTKEEAKVSAGTFSYNVLLLSSMGRSGSSFLGELLTSVNDTIYCFEPFHDLQELGLLTERTAVDGLRGIFTCNMSNPVLRTFITNRLFGFRSIPRRCDHRKPCLTKEIIDERCRMKSIRVVKTIRTRVAWLESIFNDSSINVKVIHLVRDPRPSIISGWDRGWTTLKADRACTDLTEDFRSGMNFRQKYQDKYIAVRYEDMCDDPLGIAKYIFSFLGYKKLPKSTESFLQRSTNSRDLNDPFGVRRNTRKMSQKWRLSITESQLEDIQGACAPIISELGFQLFKNISDVRNFSVPLYGQIHGHRMFQYDTT